MPIKHYQHQEIDKQKWDDVISTSENHLFYAYSWYLDIVSPDWEALIWDDYEYIMPLPIKRKFKIPYLVQPVLTQQLGVFSKKKIDSEIMEKFVHKIPYYSYELNLNEKNHYPEIEDRPNYLLDLSPSYELISGKFSKNTFRNIDKALKAGLNICTELDVNEFLDFYDSVQKNYQSVNIKVIKRLTESDKASGMIQFWGIRDKENELIAILSMVVSYNRITYLLPVSNEKGKKLSAMFMIVNEMILKYSGKNYVLDFEGSSVEGIARFYKGFGAENHPYFVIRKFRPSFLVGRI